jgi:hypothetical protein
MEHVFISSLAIWVSSSREFLLKTLPIFSWICRCDLCILILILCLLSFLQKWEAYLFH